MDRLTKQRQPQNSSIQQGQRRSVANSSFMASPIAQTKPQLQDNRPEAIPQRKLQQLARGTSQQHAIETVIPHQTFPQSSVAQRVLHKGKTARSKKYVQASSVKKKKANGVNYTATEIQEFMDSSKHYHYNIEKQVIEKIKNKPNE